MKKSILFFAAFAALLFSACQKKENIAPEGKQVSVNFVANEIGTKTAFGDPEGNKYPVLWTSGDKVSLYLNLDYNNGKVAEVTPSADGKSATFSAVFTPATTNVIVAVYPSNCVKSANATKQTINVEIPTAQTSTPSGPDPAAQMLVYVSDPMAADEIPATLAANFVHLTAYGHLKFVNTSLNGATVSAVNISVSTNFIGRYFFWKNHDAGDDKVGEWSGGDVSPNAAGNAITINTTTLDDVWFSAAPVDLSGKTMTITVATDQGTLTKEVTFPANSKLTAGKSVKMTIDMSGIGLVEPQVYKLVKDVRNLNVGDKVLVVSAGELEHALGSTQNGNNRSSAGITKVDDTISDPAASVEILELEDGAINGTFALKAAEGYLYAAGGGNYLRTQASINEAASWAISIDQEGNTKIISQAPAVSQNELRYNNNSGNNLFSAYASSSSCKPVVLYRKDVTVAATPRFNAILPDDSQVSASGKTVYVQVFGNVDWSASASDGATLSTDSGIGTNLISVVIPENTTTSDRSFTVTVSTTADVTTKTYNLTISQKGKSSNPSTISVGTVLWSESWAGGAKDKTPAEYQALSTASTVVYGGESVTYTSADGGSKTKLYDDALVYVPNPYTGSLPKPENPYNLLLSKSNGWWKIAGIPCKGVAKAKLTIHSNYGTSAYFNPSSTETGVSFGTMSATNYNSDWTKKVYVVTYDITFTGSLETFDLTLKNTNSGNVRVTDLSIEVTEAK